MELYAQSVERNRKSRSRRLQENISHIRQHLEDMENGLPLKDH